MKSYARFAVTNPYTVVRQNRQARVRAGVFPLTDNLPRGRRPASSTGPVSNPHGLESPYFTPLKCGKVWKDWGRRATGISRRGGSREAGGELQTGAVAFPRVVEALLYRDESIVSWWLHCRHDAARRSLERNCSTVFRLMTFG